VVTKERRRKLAREKYERRQQRMAEQRAKSRRRNVAVVVAVGLVLVVGLGSWGAVAAFSGGGGKKKAAGDPCGTPAKGSPAKKTWKKEPALTVDRTASYTMSLATTCGQVTVSMDASKAPHTVNSFAFLAKNKYFDHTKCHRLVTQNIYVLQCGDPTASGSGTPGYHIPDEDLKDPAIKNGVYPAGTVAMANNYSAQTKQGRDTGGSQFFLVYKDSTLPPDYTPFGRVTSGMDVLKKIAAAGTVNGAPDGPPKATVVIDRATVTRA
jgi:peptidyl-prolyl cis-trans isomerase B (cyclophilin B)